MAQTESDSPPPAPLEEIQRQWAGLTLRVQQLHTGLTALEAENKTLRALIETAIEHRRKSHGELVNQLAGLVAKLPLNDVGVVISRLVEHNTAVGEVSTALLKGNHDGDVLQSSVLRALDKTRADMRTMIPALVQELIRLDAPFKPSMLETVATQPENFFSPPMVRASRGFVKGQVARERIVKDFGEAALPLFKDVTTDVKFNPRPKPEEIMLAFVPEFETLLPQQTALTDAQRADLLALYHRVRASRANTDTARAQKAAFLKLSFLAELLHYYDNQQNESPDIVFAQRLPPLIEQLVIGPETTKLDEQLICQAEALLALVLHPDHRQAVINNFGKVGGLAKSLRLVLTFRPGKFSEHDPETTEFVKHLFSLQKTPDPAAFAAVLQFIGLDMQKSVIRGISMSDRLRREEALELSKAVARVLNVPEVVLAAEQSAPVLDTKHAWEQIRELIATRAGPGEVATAIRKRLHEKYDSDEVRESWLTLADSEPLLLIRVVCLLPYLPDGQTDPIARAVLESYANRLTHEKYAITYNKIIGALRNLFKVKADSPALVNFVALVKWVDAPSAERIAKDVGMTLA